MESSDEIHVILKAYHFVMGRGLILLQKNKRAINIFGKKKNSEAFWVEYFVDSIMQKTFKLMISSFWSSLSSNLKVSTRMM